MKDDFKTKKKEANLILILKRTKILIFLNYKKFMKTIK